MRAFLLLLSSLVVRGQNGTCSTLASHMCFKNPNGRIASVHIKGDDVLSEVRSRWI